MTLLSLLETVLSASGLFPAQPWTCSGVVGQSLQLFDLENVGWN